MPSNQTPNYSLSQWLRDDRVLMEDFNADNAKIDAALKEHAGQLARLPFCGNCQIYTQTYTGTGTFGEDNPKSLYFSYPPKLVVIVGPNGIFMIMVHGSPHALFPNSSPPPYNMCITWNGNYVSWFGNHVNSQMNASGAAYYVVALCSKS